MLSLFVSGLQHLPLILFLGTLVALAPLLWSKLRASAPPGLSALGLAALPMGVALAELQLAFGALPPVVPASKLDPRFVVLTRVGELPFSGATLSVVVIGLTVAMAPALRRAALALLPGALGHLGLGLVLRAHIMEVALLPQDEKVERWLMGEPERVAAMLVTALVCAAVAVRAERPEIRAVALAGALPVLCWPGWLIWWMLTGLEAG